MRSKILVLLAVASTLANAGLVRHSPSARYVSSAPTPQSPASQLIQRRSGNLVRSFNQSSIPIAPAIQPTESTSDSSPAVVSTPSLGTASLPSAKTAAITSALPSKQVGSVPAVGNGPGAASIESSASTTLSTKFSSSVARPSTTLETSTHGKPPTTLESSLPAVPSTSRNSSTALKPSPIAASSSSRNSSSTLEPSPIAASSSSRKDGEPTSTKQVGSVPAVGSGPGAASQEDPLTTKTSSSFSRLFTLNTGVNSGTAIPTSEAKSISSLLSVPNQSIASSAIASPSLASQPPAPAALSTSQARNQSSAHSEPSSAINTVVSLSSSSPSGALSVTSQIPTITDVPSTNGNRELAIQFNQYFSSMNANSQCSPDLNSQASACINGQIARCGSDRKYVLTACPEGQQCLALPLDNNSKGVSIQCIRPSDADAKLGSGQSSSIITTPGVSTSSVGSAAETATIQGLSSTSVQGSVTLLSQSLTVSPKTPTPSTISTGNGTSVSATLPAEAQPTISIKLTSTKIVSIFTAPTPTSASTSHAVSATSTNTGSPSPVVSSATSATTIGSASIVSAPSQESISTAISTAQSSKESPPGTESPTSVSKVSAAPSIQTSKPNLPSTSSTIDDQPEIIITPVSRRPAKSVSPTQIESPTVHANAAYPVTTNTPIVSGSLSTVTETETVTVTMTVHDRS